MLRLPDGTLLIHSPVAMTGALRDAVDALGAVAHFVSPNLYHHVYAGAWKAAYPHAKLHGPARLARKRRDLRFDAELSARADPAWGGALVPVPIDGCALHETVFVPPGVVDPRRRRRYLPRLTAGAHCSHSADERRDRQRCVAAEPCCRDGYHRSAGDPGRHGEAAQGSFRDDTVHRDVHQRPVELPARPPAAR